MNIRKNNTIEPCCSWAEMYVTERRDQAYLEAIPGDGIYLIDPALEPMGVLRVPIIYCPFCGARTVGEDASE